MIGDAVNYYVLSDITHAKTLSLEWGGGDKDPEVCGGLAKSGLVSCTSGDPFTNLLVTYTLARCHHHPKQH